MLTESLLRALRICKEGKEASLQKSGVTFACFCGMLAERGLVRSVKHRDHTRTYALTEDGKAVLRQADCRECSGLGEVPALRNPLVGAPGQWKTCPACGGPWEMIQKQRGA